MRHNVESNGFGERPALTDSDDIALLDRKGRRAMHSDVLVTLLETTIFCNVMKIVSPNHNGSLHLSGDDESLKNATADGDIARKRALFVYEVRFNGRRGGLDSETNRLDESHGLGLAQGTNGALASDKDPILLLIGLFVLIALGVFFRDAGHDMVI